METASNTPNVFEFESYRDFLKAAFEFRKAKNKRFSYAAFASRTGTSTSYLKQVIAGRRQMSLEKLAVAADAFGLNESETNFFVILGIRDICNEEKSSDFFSKVLCQLSSLSRLNVSERPVRTAVGEVVFSTWLNLVIFELARFEGFTTDPDWIRKQIFKSAALSDSQIQKAVSELIASGALVVDGKIVRSGGDLFEQSNAFHLSGAGVHKAMIHKLLEVIDDRPSYRPNLLFQGAFGLNEVAAKKLGELNAKFVSDVMAIADSCKKPDRIVIINYSSFGIAQASKE